MQYDRIHVNTENYDNTRFFPFTQLSLMSQPKCNRDVSKSEHVSTAPKSDTKWHWMLPLEHVYWSVTGSRHTQQMTESSWAVLHAGPEKASASPDKEPNNWPCASLCRAYADGGTPTEWHVLCYRESLNNISSMPSLISVYTCSKYQCFCPHNQQHCHLEIVIL